MGMKEYFGEDLCSAAAQAYLESILNGGDAAEANAAAATAYKAASRAGATITPGSPCEAAKTSFVRNYNSGKDVVQEATLAFVEAWPGAEEGNPCASSGKAYMEAIINGKSQKAAALGASKAFIAAFDALAKGGKSLKAALGYAGKSSDQDPSRTAAMLTFINKSIESGEKIADPVCAAATLAYLDAKIAKKSDKEAAGDASLAYLAAIAENPEPSAACKDSATAYIETLSS